MDMSKAARCIAPEITQGATMPSHDSPAIRARNQGLIAPPPEWSASPEAFTAQAAPVFAGHPGAGARFIGDDQPMGLFLHKLLPPAPVISCHIVPVALRAFRAHRRSPGDYWAIRPFDMCILLHVYPWRRRSASVPLVEQGTPSAAGNAACNSTKGMSGSGSISSASSAQNATNGSSLPLPLPGPDGRGSRGLPSRTFRPPSRGRRGT